MLPRALVLFVNLNYLKKLNDGTLEADEALELFLAPNAKKKEIRAIMNSFEGHGNETAIGNLKGRILGRLF